MAKYNNEITWHLKTQLDDSGINKLITSLKKVESIAQNALKVPVSKNMETQLNGAIKSAQKLQEIIHSSFSTTTGTFSTEKFAEGIVSSGRSMTSFGQSLAKIGPEGNKAFNDVLGQVVKVNSAAMTTSKTLEKIANTAGNTVRWGIMASAFQQITGEISTAFNYIKALDTSLNGIRIVTGKSAEEMSNFAVQANKSANILGGTTKEYTEASRIFFEQGLGNDAVKARTDIVVQAAHVAHQTTEEMSNQMTGIWNGYKVQTQDVGKFADKLAAVAAYSASNFEELSKAINKTAAAANVVGVNFDQLNAMVATSVSVTKQAPELVGTAYKTVLARIADLKATGKTTDEEGFQTTLGVVSKQLKDMGVNILDTEGQLRNMGDVITEIGTKWQGWTENQKMAAAQAMAGKRQYVQLVALFDNWDMYTRNLNTSLTSFGALNAQNNIELESMQEHFNKLTTASENLYGALANSEGINPLIDTMTNFVNLLAEMVKGIGGGSNVILGLAALITRVFSVQISGAIAGAIHNVNAFFANIKDKNASMKMINQSLYEMGKLPAANVAGRAMLDVARQALPYFKLMSQEQRGIYNSIIDQTQALYQQQSALKDNNRQLVSQYNSRFKSQKELKALPENARMLSLDQKDDGTYKKGIERIGLIGGEVNKGFSFQLGIDAKASTDLLKDFSGQAQELRTQLTAVKEGGVASFNALTESVATTVSDFTMLPSLTKIERKEIMALETAFIKLASDPEATPRQISEAYTALGGKLAEVTKTVQQFDATVKNVDLNKLKTDAKAAQENIKASGQGIEGFFKSLKMESIINSGTKLAGNLMTISFAMTALSNIGDIWNDKTLSGWDRIVQLTSSFGMLIPGVIAGVEILIPALNSMSTALLGVGAAEGVATAGVSVLLAAIAGLLVILGGMVIDNMGATEKAAKAAEALYATQKAELEANTALVSQYESSLETYKKTKDGKQGLLELSVSLSKAYKDNSIRLAALAGDYDLVTQKIKVHEQTKRKAVADAALGKFKTMGSQEVTGLDLTRDLAAGPFVTKTLGYKDTKDRIALLESLKIKSGNSFDIGQYRKQEQPYVDSLKKMTAAGQDFVNAQSSIFMAAKAPSEYVNGATEALQKDVMAQAAVWSKTVDGAVSLETAMSTLYTQMASQPGVAAAATKSYADFALALEAGALKGPDLNKLIKDFGPEAITRAIEELKKIPGQKIDLSSILTIMETMKIPKLKIKAEFDPAALKKAEDGMLDAQKKVEDQQKKVNDAATKWGKTSGNYLVAVVELKELKDALIAAKAEYIKNILIQRGFSSAAATSAAAILAQGKAAAQVKLDGLRAQLDSTRQAYINLASAAAQAMLTTAFAADRIQKIRENATTDVEKTPGKQTAQRAYLQEEQAKLKEQMAAINSGINNPINIPKATGDGTTPKKDKAAADKAAYVPTKEELPITSVDIYHDIDQEIQRLTNDMDKLSAAQAKLVGPALLKSLDQQTVALKQQVQYQKDKLELQQKDLSNQQKGLREYGVNFDSKGQISNYMAKMTAAQNAVDNSIKKYNAISDEKGQTAQKKVTDAATKYLDALKKRIDDYDKLVNSDIAASSKAIDDFQTKLDEISMLKFTTQLEKALSLSDLQKSWNTFQAGFVQNLDMDKAINKTKVEVENLSAYFSASKSGNIDVLSSSLAKVNVEITKMQQGKVSSIFGSDMAKATTEQKDLYDKLIAAGNDYAATIKTIKADLSAMVTEGIADLKDLNTEFDFVNSSLSHQASLIKLLYGDKAYTEMNSYYKAQEANNTVQLNFLHQQLDVLTKARSGVDKKSQPELWKTYNTAIEEAQGSIDKLIESSLQNVVSEYQNAVTGIMSAFNKGLTGGMDLDKMAQDWKNVNSNAARYLDTVTAAYSINKLQSSVTKAINSSSDVHSKEKIAELMNAEIKNLETKKNLTQYDVDRANQLLDIEQKRISLEDSLNSKTTMRLMRDSQGNMGYVYGANQGDALQKQQDLNDAKQGLYAKDKEAYQKNLDEMLTAQTAWTKDVQAIYADQTLSEIDRQEQLTELNNYYGTLINGITADNEVIRQNYKIDTFSMYETLYGKDSAAFAALVVDQDSTMAKADKNWNSSVQKMIDKFSVGPDSFKEATAAVYAQLNTANVNYTKSVDTMQIAVGNKFTDVTASIKGATSATAALHTAVDPLISTFDSVASKTNSAATALKGFSQYAANAAKQAGDLATYTHTALSQLAGFRTDGGQGNLPSAPGPVNIDWSHAGADETASSDFGQLIADNGGDIAAISKQVSGSDGVLGKLIKASDKAEEAFRLMTSYSQTNRLGPTSYDCSGLVTAVLTAGGIMPADSFIDTANAGSQGWANGPGEYITIGRRPGHMAMSIGQTWYDAGSYPLQKRNKDHWTNYYHPVGFDTGGYTGSWAGGGGKAAVLHEKEIILNKQDTSNLLGAVSAIRDVTSNLKTGAINSTQGLVAAMHHSYGNITPAAGTLDQQVSISASFPGVKSSIEIEKAFDSLVNTASQYVNKSKSN